MPLTIEYLLRLDDSVNDSLRSFQTSTPRVSNFPSVEKRSAVAQLLPPVGRALWREPPGRRRLVSQLSFREIADK